MELNPLAHRVYQCGYYIELVTKCRKEIFEEQIFACVNKKLAEIMEYYPLITGF